MDGWTHGWMTGCEDGKMATPSPALLNTQRGQSLVWVQHPAGTGAAWVLWVPGLAPALRRPSSAQLRGPGPIPLLRLPPSLPCPGGVPGQDKPLPAALHPYPREGWRRCGGACVPTQHGHLRAPSCQGRVCAGQAGTAAAAATCCLSQPLPARLFARPAKTGRLPGSAERDAAPQRIPPHSGEPPKVSP